MFYLDQLNNKDQDSSFHWDSEDYECPDSGENNNNLKNSDEFDPRRVWPCDIPDSYHSNVSENSGNVPVCRWCNGSCIGRENREVNADNQKNSGNVPGNSGNVPENSGNVPENPRCVPENQGCLM